MRAVIIRRGYRFKLAPKPAQEEQFRQFAGVCRLVYNLALEQRRDWWRQYERNVGRRLTCFDQINEITDLRAELDWIAAVPRTCQEQALKDLDQAFVAFFGGHRDYPTPRKKGINESFRFRGRECSVRRLNAKWSAVRLPKIGEVMFRDTRRVLAGVRDVTISLDASGWHISFSCEIESTQRVLLRTAVGVDRGVANALSLSTGEMVVAPASFAAIAKRRKKAQRVLARRKKGSRRYAKQRAKVAKLHAKAGRIRKDWLHRVSTDIARRFGVVAIEALRIKNMTRSAAGTAEAPGRNVAQKRGLNRSILEQGWGIFEAMLVYKLAERGGTLIKVDPRYTSQTCQACGTVDAKSRKSQATFVCVACGHADHADTNAALEILRRSTAWLDVEGHQLRPVETSTGGLAA